MQYHSPLHIIPEENWDKLTSAELNKWRKEVLLRFDLKGNTTIKIKGRSYDKDSIINAFEDLKKDNKHHLKVHDNPFFLAFLEEGKVAYFENPNFENLFNDPDFSNWLSPYFQHQISNIFYKAVKTGNFHYINRLKVISSAYPKIPKWLIEPALAKTHNFLEENLNEASKKYKNPLHPKKKDRFKKGLEAYLNTSFLEALKNLPSSFMEIQHRYAYFAESILFTILHKPTKIADLPVPTLRVLELAAEMYLAFVQDSQLPGILRDIKDALSGRFFIGDLPPTKYARLGFLIISFLFLWFFLFKAKVDLPVKQPNNRNYRLLKSDLLGVWEYEASINEQNTFYETVTFYDESFGSIEIEVKEQSGISKCSFHIPFRWNLIGRTKIELKYWGFANQSCSNFDFEKRNLKLMFKRLENDFETGFTSTTINHYEEGEGNEVETIGFRFRYQYKGPAFSNIFEDFERLPAEQFERLGKLVNVQFLYDDLLQNLNFEEKEERSRYRLHFDPKSEQFFFRFQEDSLPFATYEVRNGEAYLKTKSWSTYTPLRRLGYFENISYIDENGESQKGTVIIQHDATYKKIQLTTQ